MRDWLLSATKFVLSFRKREWELSDYPVRVRHFEASEGTSAAWVASIVRWSLVGFGPTREAALHQLGENLATAKREGRHPRPGSRPPIEFAGADNLARHGDAAYEFVEQVTGITPMFMSDGTSLTDFADGDELEAVRRKVSILHGLEAASIIEEPLWKVLDKAFPRHEAVEQRDATDEGR